MIQKVVIDEGVVLVTADGRDSAERQARSLSRDMKRSLRLKRATEYAPGLYALGIEAVLVAKAGGKVPKRKWRGHNGNR